MGPGQSPNQRGSRNQHGESIPQPVPTCPCGVDGRVPSEGCQRVGPRGAVEEPAAHGPPRLGAAYRATRSASIPGGCTPFPSHVAPQPLYPQHSPRAPHWQPRRPVTFGPYHRPYRLNVAKPFFFCRRRSFCSCGCAAVRVRGFHCPQGKCGGLLGLWIHSIAPADVPAVLWSNRLPFLPVARDPAKGQLFSLKAGGTG